MDTSSAGDALLSEDMQVDGRMVKVTLNGSGVIRWESSSSSDTIVDVQDDLLSFARDDSILTLVTFKTTQLDRFCASSRTLRVRKDVVLQFRDRHSLEPWFQSIQECLNRAGRPRRLFVFLNPFGGKKLAKKIYQQQVQPLLDVAGVQCTLQETRHQGHARDLAKSMDLSPYDGIVCVSGDGVLVEVLNGLLKREDWRVAIRTPLGVIPAGTGNGMAKSLLHHGKEPCNVANATFAIIKGYKQSLDVATVVQGQACFHSVLLLTWGIVADVDFESEKLRCLGNLRNRIYSLIRIICLREYNGSLAYVPAPGYEGSGDVVDGESQLFPTEITDTDASGGSGYTGPVSVPERSQWRSMDGDFVMVWLQNVPWASEHVCAAPRAEFADGFLDLIVIKDCPRWKVLSLFLKLSDGSHVDSRHVEYLKVGDVLLLHTSQYG